MSRFRLPFAHGWALVAVLVAPCLSAAMLLGQEPEPAPDDVAPEGPIVGANVVSSIETSPVGSEFPGVWRTIDPASQVNETYSRHDLVELLSIYPTYGERPWSRNLAKDVRFEHDVWNLEFSFKPPRMIEVDLPASDGRLTKKNVWYLVYRVRNPGETNVRFIPRFLLESHDTGKIYPDRVIPVAALAIQEREATRQRLMNTVEMTGLIPFSEEGADDSAFGVATWTDVDEATDRFSIYVQGLSNAYRWEDSAAAPGSAGRSIYPKTLQLNFWRPGDDRDPHESEIRFGIPEDAFTIRTRDFAAGGESFAPSGDAKLALVASRLSHIVDSYPTYPVMIETAVNILMDEAARATAKDLDETRRVAVVDRLEELGVRSAIDRVMVIDPNLEAEFRTSLEAGFTDEPEPPADDAAAVDPALDGELADPALDDPALDDPAADPVAAAGDPPAAAASAPLDTNIVLGPPAPRPKSMPGAFWVYVEPNFLYKGEK